MKQWNQWLTLGTFAATVAFAAPAAAEVKLDGEWADSPKVSLHLEHESKETALAQLAKQAGWSLVLHVDQLGGPVTLDVTDANAKDVLESVLADGSFVAQRRGEGGKLLEVRGALAPAHAPPAPPPVPGVPDAKGKRDRAVLGHDLRIEKDEVVGDVSVTGGSVDIYGTVEGDLVVTGGSATIHDGGRVTGDTLAVGGRVHVEKGGHADGDNKVIGGVFDREEETSLPKPAESHEHESTWATTKRKSSDFFGNFAFLFVVGALFLATAPERMLRLRTAVVEKPVASVAYGLGGLFGSIAAVVVLCLTVVGIPFAIAFLLLAALAVTGSLAATLTTCGEALLAHRSKNQYVHLALGAALYSVAGLLPFLGGWIQAALFFASVGVLVTTRVAGYVRRKGEVQPSSGMPYR